MRERILGAAVALFLAAFASGQGCPTEIRLPSAGAFGVPNGSEVTFTFNAKAGDKIAARADGIRYDDLYLNTRFGSIPSISLVGPGGLLASASGVSASIPASGEAFTVPADGRYCLTFSANGALNAHSVAYVGVPGQSCDLSLSTAKEFSAEGQFAGFIPLYLIYIPGCTYPVSSDRSWIVPDRPAARPGFSQVGITLEPNAGPKRTGYLTVGTSRIAITQQARADPACSYALTRPAFAVPAEGGSGSEAMTATPAGVCGFLLQSSAPWLTLASPLSGMVSGSQPISWTATPNFGTRPRQATILAANQQILVTQAGNTAPESARFVQLLYWSYFGRMPSSAEVEFHRNSGLSRSGLALSFFQSAEFASGGLYAAGLYAGILNRDPEYGGWLFQRRALREGIATKEQLVTNFLNSTEYRISFGYPSNTDFVRQMYRQVLGREGSEAEVAYHEGFLTTAAARAEIAKNFLNSAEFAAKTLPRIHGAMMYFTLLNRDPAPWERESLRQQLASGRTLQSAIGDFVASPELALILQ